MVGVLAVNPPPSAFRFVGRGTIGVAQLEVAARDVGTVRSGFAEVRQRHSGDLGEEPSFLGAVGQVEHVRWEPLVPRRQQTVDGEGA
ncbi:hypothetical protein ALI144C_47555 [Actinosynnema sp. ALI-1.44]|nr:hypothetical protein ALI144C_47555 [Actinosynnema sp. ALI-1.44]